MKQYIESIWDGTQDPLDKLEKSLAKLKEINEKHNYVVKFSEELARKQAQIVKTNPDKKPLAGVMVSVKDAICVKGIESRAGSAILNGYKPLFNSTAVSRVIDAGGIIIGKTAQDEFGFGSFNANVGNGYKIPTNPIDPNRCCGGSSGGSAGLVKAFTGPHVSLGESTGGSIVDPAAFCGVVGLCPTYGRVSRYGLIDYASSLDKIGPMGKTVNDVARLLSVISGYDEHDSTSSSVPVENYLDEIDQSVAGKKIGLIKESMECELDSTVQTSMKKAISILERKGAEIIEVSLPLNFECSIQSYYITAMSEASSNLSKLCGIRYGASEPLEGSYDEYFTKVRSKHFGKEAKRRILIGTFARMAGFRDAYYIKAAKIRRMIINEYKQTFNQCDTLLSPSMPIIAPKFKELDNFNPMKEYAMDIMTAGANFAGVPHISVPIKGKEMPAGIMFIGNHFEEKKILQAAKTIETIEGDETCLK